MFQTMMAIIFGNLANMLHTNLVSNRTHIYDDGNIEIDNTKVRGDIHCSSVFWLQLSFT